MTSLRTLFFVLPFIFAAQPKDVTVTVRNPLDIERNGEIVSVDLGAIRHLRPEWKGVTLEVMDGRTALVSQSIDNDADGIDDELIFPARIAPRGKRSYSLRPGPHREHPSPVDVRYVLPRQDIGWENDRIAFRVYGSVLAGNVDNGIDVWTKRVAYPVVAKWYKESEGSLPGKDTYHQDRGEGADFFSVGRSLGAGSAGLLFNGRLVQPGLFDHHRVIGNGPLRVSLELYYTDAVIDTHRFTLVKRITLDAGSQLNRIDERYVSNASFAAELAAGLVKRANTVPAALPSDGVLALWGPTNADSVNGFLGTGVVLPASGTLREDSTQVLITMPVEFGRSISYLSGAAWSRRGGITSAAEWSSLLASASRRLRHPLIVTVSSR